jgi:hypothetical protein
LVAVAGAALVLVGCTGDPGGEPSTTDAASAGTPAPVDVSGTELPTASDTTASPVELPFAPYFDGARAAWLAANVGTDTDTSRAEWFDQVEAFTAECMAKAGFDYKAVPYQAPEPTEEDNPYVDRSALDIQSLPGALEEVERVGYGVDPPAYRVSQADLEGWYDPNADYVDSLSESGRDAYNNALNGIDPETYETVNPDNCMSLAYDKYPEPDTSGPDLSFLEPADGMDRLFEVVIDWGSGMIAVDPSNPDALISDPALLALNKEYGDCALSNEYAEYLYPGQIEPSALVGITRITAADGSVRDVSPGASYDPDTLPEDQRFLVGSLAERDIAVVDFKCRQQTDYVNRYAKAVAAAQTKYLSEHQAEVDKMMAQIEDFLANHKNG